MKTIIAFASLLTLACGTSTDTELELELETINQASYIGKPWAQYYWGVNVNTTTSQGRDHRQCSEGHPSPFCIVPSASLPQFDGSGKPLLKTHFIWVDDFDVIEEDPEGDFATLSSNVSSAIRNRWILPTNNAAPGWLLTWPPDSGAGIRHQFVHTKRINTPSGIPISIQGRIGGEQTNVPGTGWDRNKAGSYVRVDARNCTATPMFEEVAVNGVYYGCDVVKVWIHESRIADTATAWSNDPSKNVTYQRVRDALVWQIAGQAFFFTQGIGTTSTTDNQNPLRTSVWPLAELPYIPCCGASRQPSWMMRPGQKCMLQHSSGDVSSSPFYTTDPGDFYFSNDCDGLQ